MRTALIARKIGMTQMYDETGRIVPVTVLRGGPCFVVQIKRTATDGYAAVQLGFDEAPEKRLTKAEAGHAKKHGAPPVRVIEEIRLAEEDVAGFSEGQPITTEIFAESEYVDIAGRTIGKGFTGVVKRHGFRGGSDTHGSMSHRAPGSIGGTTRLHRVLPGLRMAGRSGNERVTVQNLRIVKIFHDKGLILVKGAVPGPRGRYLLVRKAIKKSGAK